MELRSDHDTLIGGPAPDGIGGVRTIVAKVGACSHAGYAWLINAARDRARLRAASGACKLPIAEQLGGASGVTVVIHGRERPFGVDGPSSGRQAALSSAMTR